MAGMEDYTPEQIQEMIDKAQRELEETLSKMTPEERAEAERKAQQALREDEAKRQRLLDSAAELLGKSAPTEKPKFCPNCGAPAGSGNFCEYCGTKL